MKISIITVVYNNQHTIAEAIQSVLSQSYPEVEYLIIDGKSTDETLSIVKRFEQRIDKIVSEPDQGIYDAMNKGIALATGSVIGILNSDDLYADPEVLADVMQIFQRDPALDAVYGDLVYVKANRPDRVVRTWKSRAYYPSFFEHGHVPPHPALFLRKEVYKLAGNFNTAMKLAADYELMLRIFKRYAVRSSYFPRLCVKMRLGGATNQNIGNIIAGNLEVLRAWRMNGLKVPFMLVPFRIAKRLIQFIR